MPNQTTQVLSFLDDTACPFHNSKESGLCGNFLEFGQNFNLWENLGIIDLEMIKHTFHLCSELWNGF